MALQDAKDEYAALSESDKKSFMKWALIGLSQYNKEDIVDEFYASYGVTITITNPSGATPPEIFIRPVGPTRNPRL